MKTSLYTLPAALALLLLTIPPSFAQMSEIYVDGVGSETIQAEKFTLIINPLDGPLLDVSITKQPYAHVQIQVRDDKKTTLYTCHSRTNAPLFARRLDLHETEDGTYWLDVWVDKRHIARRLQLTTVDGKYRTVILPQE